jgi:hypothetical protein
MGTFTTDYAPLHWFSANGSPDHLQNYLPYGSQISLPLNVITFQHPYEGFSCAGVVTYHQNGTEEGREWIMAPLVEALVPGTTYYCSFRANAGFGGIQPTIFIASNNVGMLFTTETREWNWDMPFPQPPNYAHVYHPEIIADTVGWTLVSASFVADSAYQYVMIGNFFNNAFTDTIHLGTPGSVTFWYPTGYTLIDDVCVSPNPAGCDLAHVIAEGALAEVSIHPNPAQNELRIANGAGSNASVHDMLGRVIWQGRIEGEPWELDVQAWERAAYVLRMERHGQGRIFKFVLIE